MKLTFTIPAYNEEACLSKCLDSIFREMDGITADVEIIVVNNASTDRTKEIALSYPGIKVIDEPRKGLVKARQAGYKAATGDLIANIDADNMLTHGWIRKVFGEFSGNENLIALSGPIIYYDLPRIINIQVKIFYGLGYITNIFNNYIFKKGAMLQGGNFVVKKSALEKIGGYDTDIDFYGEDTDIACRLRKAGPVKFTFKLPIYSSGRRLAAEGIFRTGLRYAANYFWVIFLKKPYSEKSTDIRV